MAENPFDPKNAGLLGALGSTPRGLLDLISTGVPTPPDANAPCGLLGEGFLPTFETTPSSGLAGIFGSGLASIFGSPPTFLPLPPQPVTALAKVLASEPPLSAPPSPPARPFGLLADLIAPLPPRNENALIAPLPKPTPVEPDIKRRVFFSFHFDDVMRVNNVRNAWKITHPDGTSNRSFRDSSLWESRKYENPETIKQLIRAGVLNTSAVCVLAGSMTWDRRWVRYEIARAIIDGRGLLTVHLNNINHHQTKGPHSFGPNPLDHMGIAKLQPNKRLPFEYYIYEMTPEPDGLGGTIHRWSPYGDYTKSVEKPGWLSDPPLNHVMPLSVDTAEYDYVRDYGHRNIGSWIDKAAKQAGR